jgi:hypothetical protein
MGEAKGLWVSATRKDAIIAQLRSIQGQPPLQVGASGDWLAEKEQGRA